MKKLLALALALFAIGAAHARLEPRDLDLSRGPDAFYDTVRGITLLRDGNYAGTTGVVFNNLNPGVPQPSGWADPSQAQTWLQGLDIGGITGWRMPQGTIRYLADGEPCVKWGCTLATSEIGVVAGNPDFYNVQSAYYVRAEGPNGGWWWFFNGTQYLENTFPGAIWVVHDGDVGTPVPEPQTWALLLAGLTMMALLRKRRSQ